MCTVFAQPMEYVSYTHDHWPMASRCLVIQSRSLGQWLPLSGYTITCLVIQSRSLCQWLPLSGYTITILIGPMASRCLVINLPSGIEYTHCHLARYVIPTTLVVCFLSFGTILCRPHNIIVVCFLYLFH